MNVEPSAMDRRLRAMGTKWEPEWSILTETSRNALGRPIAIACATPSPPIADMHMLEQAFCDMATDDEVRALHRTLSKGTQVERRAAVDAAMSKVFGRMVDRTAPDNDD